jgi:hypothetical protein
MPVIAECGSEKVGQFFLLSSTVIFLINNAQHPKFKIKSTVFLLMYIIMGTKSWQILAILVAICQCRNGMESLSPILPLPCSSIALKSSLLSSPRLMWARRSPTQGQLSLP